MAVYAFLVGIDDYQPPTPRLAGCRHDVEDAERFLREHTTGTAELAVETLCDRDATRAAVIGTFRRQLGRAGPADTALFWFSGHGSTAPVPPQWWHLEPSGRLQTLVCADSRQDGVPDLLDKELAILIREVAAGGAHVAVVLDCCHAAGATRAAAATRTRLAPQLATPPDPDRLLPELRGAVRDGTVPAGIGTTDHVALAACREFQAAYEFPDGDRPRGLFSLALLTELRRPGRAPTYRELLAGTRSRVERIAPQQVPVLHPIGQPVVDQPFLGGQVRPPATTLTMRYADGAWEIDAGACHGLRPGSPDDPVRVAVHRSEPVRQARLVGVGAQRSPVAPIGWQPDPDRRYPVVVSRVPLPATTVAIGTAGGTGDPGTSGRVAAAIRSAGPDGGPSPHLRLVPAGDPAQPAELVVDTPAPGRFRILGADGTCLTGDIPDRDGSGPARTVQQLEHIARWRQIRDLANDQSRLAGAVRLEVVPAGPGEPTAPLAGPSLPAGADGGLALAYRPGPSGWQAPEVFIRLHNPTDRRLYCVLLDLTDRFRIHPALLPGTFIGPGQTAAAAGGRPITLSLPPGREVRPGAEVSDWLLLIVAEDEINSDVFRLPRLGEPGPARTRAPAGMASIVERLGLTALHRDADPPPDTAGDWWTATLRVVTRVPGRSGPPGLSGPPDRPGRGGDGHPC